MMYLKNIQTGHYKNSIGIKTFYDNNNKLLVKFELSDIIINPIDIERSLLVVNNKKINYDSMSSTDYPVCLYLRALQARMDSMDNPSDYVIRGGAGFDDIDIILHSNKISFNDSGFDVSKLGYTSPHFAIEFKTGVYINSLGSATSSSSTIYSHLNDTTLWYEFDWKILEFY